MGRGLPALVALQERLGDARERLAILAFHDDSVESFDELDEKLAPIVENAWKGRELPFPILLDRSGETLKTWGIRAFPTTVLIDPEGNIVGTVGEDAVEEYVLGERR